MDAKQPYPSRAGYEIPAKYVDHPSLHRSAYVRSLLRQVEQSLASDAPAEVNEADLFKAMHACTYAAQARETVRERIGRSTQELIDLHHRIVEHTVNRNVGLVYDMLRRSPFWNGDDAEMISAGFWALFQAVTAFDPWLGYRFSTYACSAILRAYQHVGKRDARRRHVLSTYQEMESTEPDVPPQSEQQSLLADRLRLALEANRADLTPTEQFIIQRRFLQPGSTKADTLEKVGQMVKLSKERVRQIQMEALDKLRDVLCNDPVLQASGVLTDGAFN
jgi:RNA polymerase sigma factor (sigma-70 family)